MTNFPLEANPEKSEYIGCFAVIRKKNGGFIRAKDYGKKCFPIYRKVKPEQT